MEFFYSISYSCSLSLLSEPIFFLYLLIKLKMCYFALNTSKRPKNHQYPLSLSLPPPPPSPHPPPQPHHLSPPPPFGTGITTSTFSTGDSVVIISMKSQARRVYRLAEHYGIEAMQSKCTQRYKLSSSSQASSRR